MTPHHESQFLLSPERQDVPVDRERSPSGRKSSEIDGVHVLVVDDDPDHRGALQEALEAAHASVVAVSSVDDAIAAVDRGLPEVVVSDLGMPRRDGYDLVRTLRSRPAEEGGDVPAIALTAFSGAEVRRRSLEAGFQCCAFKPVDPEKLIATIAALAKR